MHPLDCPSSVSVTLVITHSIYHAWAISMRCALGKKNKFDFVDGPYSYRSSLIWVSRLGIVVTCLFTHGSWIQWKNRLHRASFFLRMPLMYRTRSRNDSHNEIIFLFLSYNVKFLAWFKIHILFLKFLLPWNFSGKNLNPISLHLYVLIITFVFASHVWVTLNINMRSHVQYGFSLVWMTYSI